ncbi:flagellar protein FlaG [Shewanella psychromarinicola]|uniref:Flagellar protein FlaG n=2 Tax=Shewanellaceae TaxID=267890 RepID=A0A3N4EAA7_9GAMM|nr:flagellar protein FlaG [Shewanella psychromarinicola]RPA35139.1 flagellar protein FlaG [Shewanella psychromarinicola]
MDNNLLGITHSPVSPSATNRPVVALNRHETGLDATSDTSDTSVAAPLTVEKNTYVAEADKVALAKAETETVIETEQSVADKDQQSEAEVLAEVVEQLSEVVTLMNKGLAFSVDEDSGSAIVKVMDIDTGDIIRQIPSEEALELAQKLQDVKGLLLKTQA